MQEADAQVCTLRVRDSAEHNSEKSHWHLQRAMIVLGYTVEPMFAGYVPIEWNVKY